MCIRDRRPLAPEAPVGGFGTEVAPLGRRLAAAAFANFLTEGPVGAVSYTHLRAHETSAHL
eukprot:2561984-Alexandrium_andersonii.AAC.1